MTVANTIAQIAKLAMKNSEDITKIIEAASLVVTAAGVLVEKGKPIIDEIDTAAAAARIRGAAGGAAKGAKSAAKSVDKGAGAIKKGASGAAGAVGSAFGKLGDAKDNILKELASNKDEKSLRKAVRDARQTVLENCTATMSVSDFMATREAVAAVGGIGGFDMPGCFVIATYKKHDFNKDLTDYTGIYVGRADNVSEGVAHAVSRNGNPDVYADVKFKQNTHVFIYSCMPDDVEGRYIALYQTFEAGKSYNASDDVAAEKLSEAASIVVYDALTKTVED